MRIKRGFFWRFLGGYLAFLALLTASLAITFEQVSRILIAQLYQSHRQYLQQTRVVVDQALTNASSVLDQLQVDPRVTKLSRIRSITDGSPLFYELYRAVQELPKYNLTTDLLSNYYVIYKKSGIVLAPDSAFLEDPLRILPGKNLTIPKLTSVLDRIPASTTNTDQFLSVAGGIYIIRPILSQDDGISAGIMVIVIDPKKIPKYLEALELGNEGIVAIVDESGEIITFRSGSSAIGLSEILESNTGVYIITEDVSTLTGWRFISAVPRSLVLAKAISLRRMYLLILSASTFIGIAIASLLSLRRAAPLRSLLRDVRAVADPQADDSESINSLSNEVNQILRTYRVIMETRKEQNAFLLSGFISRLFLGDFTSKQDFESMYDLVGHPPMRAPLSAVLIEWRSFDDSSHSDSELIAERRDLGIVWRQILQHQFGDDRIYSHQFSIDTLGIIICGYSQDEIVAWLKSVSQNPDRKGITGSPRIIYAGQSNEQSDIGDLFEMALRHTGMPDRERVVILGAHTDQVVRVGRYSIEREIRIIRLVREGAVDELIKTLDIVWTEVVSGVDPSDPACSLFLDMLYGTLIRTADLSGYRLDQSSANDTGSPIGERYEAIKNRFIEIVEAVHGEKRKKEKHRDTDITAFLETRFRDSMFTLADLAEEFQITEKAMYKYFNRHFGKTFSAYLEQLRLSEACRLLGSGELPIAEIGKKCGYANDHTFRRAFRKKTGVTPSNYRAATSLH